MTDLADTLQAADRTAARLLAQYPDTDINDKALVIGRCLQFDVDLRPGSGLAYAYDNVQQRGLEYRLLASAAFASYELNGLHWYARSIYDPSRYRTAKPRVVHCPSYLSLGTTPEGTSK
jgi:hypothetical protein